MFCTNNYRNSVRKASAKLAVRKAAFSQLLRFWPDGMSLLNEDGGGGGSAGSGGGGNGRGSGGGGCNKGFGGRRCRCLCRRQNRPGSRLALTFILNSGFRQFRETFV